MAEQTSGTPVPLSITVHQRSRVLEISFSSGEHFHIPFELMRVYSPSAEVTGHGPGQEVLQTGKREVTVNGIEPMGNYAIRPIFSDGHDSGLFTWSYLYKLGREHQTLWANYLQRLQEAGADRDTPMVRRGATISRKKAH
ncbi:gamma-butyrobetaine hydroxylase-like domain-containing protein [Comamonas flocculans]|uniref:DUF971 domain-containing protein n=1 Tax=Comamonas flocculans TaxID=2597701 RepID=A0A5B8RX32_9BURK|nr:DUF971 domain-containing protein [Comamonas flocculans]QEA14060.1 DUF971 domain-containing protein [Comamonas flocculans]